MNKKPVLLSLLMVMVGTQAAADTENPYDFKILQQKLGDARVALSNPTTAKNSNLRNI